MLLRNAFRIVGRRDTASLVERKVPVHTSILIMQDGREFFSTSGDSTNTKVPVHSDEKLLGNFY